MMGETDNQSVTTGELSRAVGLIRSDIKEVKKDIGEKPSRETVDNLRQRIVDLENWQTWALRLGIPGLCVAALNAVNTFGGVVSK